MKMIASIWLLTIFLTGCSHQPIDNTQTVDSSYYQGLDLSDDIKKKFEIKEKSESQIKKNPSILEKSVKKEDKRDNEQEKPSELITEKQKDTKKNTKVSKQVVELPEDYPQEYIEFDKKYSNVWKKFDSSYISKDETIKMRVSYLGLGMGSMMMKSGKKVFVGDQEAFSFEARLKTAAFYSYIYELDDRLFAQVLTKEFLPLRYSLIQRESKKDIDDIQLFDREKKILYYRYRRYRKDKDTLTKKSEDIFIPKYSLDPFSLLYFVRGLPLAVGDKYEFPVVTRDKMWVFKFRVVASEEIDTIQGKKQALKIDADIEQEGAFIKKGQLSLWFGADPGHILWQFRVGTKIGSIYARVDSID